MDTETRSAGLDALRVSAAALVLFAHGGSFLFALWPAYHVYLGVGWIGVEIFFALSGFLLVDGLLQALPASGAAAGAVTLRRLRRIVPWYAVFLLVNLLLWLLHRGTLPEGLAAYPLLLQNTVSTHPALFREAWNLPILVLFSVLAPLLALLAMRTPRPRLALAAGLVAVIVVGLLLRMLSVRYGMPEWDEGTRKFLPARWDACAWGGLAAFAVGWTRGRQAMLALVGAVLLALAVWWFARLELDADVFARTWLFSVVGAALALPLPWLFGAGRSGPALQFAALATWPLYFVNMPLVLLAAWAGLVPRQPGAMSIVVFVGWLAVSVSLAALLQRWLRPR